MHASERADHSDRVKSWHHVSSTAVVVARCNRCDRRAVSNIATADDDLALLLLQLLLHRRQSAATTDERTNDVCLLYQQVISARHHSTLIIKHDLQPGQPPLIQQRSVDQQGLATFLTSYFLLLQFFSTEYLSDEIGYVSRSSLSNQKWFLFRNFG